MENISERNRLRYAGRIPQETLDYLAAKKKEDDRFRVWDIPPLVLAVVFLAFLIARVLRHEVPLDSRDLLFSFAAIYFMVKFLRRRIRSCVA